MILETQRPEAREIVTLRDEATTGRVSEGWTPDCWKQSNGPYPRVGAPPSARRTPESTQRAWCGKKFR
jgi:hypothetical protein